MKTHVLTVIIVIGVLSFLILASMGGIILAVVYHTDSKILFSCIMGFFVIIFLACGISVWAFIYCANSEEKINSEKVTHSIPSVTVNVPQVEANF